MKYKHPIHGQDTSDGEGAVATLPGSRLCPHYIRNRSIFQSLEKSVAGGGPADGVRGKAHFPTIAGGPPALRQNVQRRVRRTAARASRTVSWRTPFRVTAADRKRWASGRRPLRARPM